MLVRSKVSGNKEIYLSVKIVFLFRNVQFNKIKLYANRMILFFGALDKSKLKTGLWFCSFVPIVNLLANNKIINGVNHVTQSYGILKE